MAISDQHGGGLTIQRVLGPELDSLHCIHIGGFSKIAPPVASVQDQSYLLPSLIETESVQRIMRRTLGDRITAGLKNRGLRFGWQWLHAARHLQRHSKAPLDARCLVVPQSPLSLRVVDQLRRSVGLKYVTWMMDDHLLRAAGDNWVYPKSHRRLMQNHLRHAGAVFVISPNLARFYRQEFGVDSQVLFGPCDPECEPTSDRPHQGPLVRLAYFGNIWPWQTDALEALVPEIKKGKAELVIYSPLGRVPTSLKVDGIKIVAPIPPQDVLSEMRRFDAVVIPISFRKELAHLSFFNIATKMSECLASGTVTLFIAPPEAAMVRFVEPYDASVLVTDPKPEVFDRAFAAIADSATRRRLLKNARAVVLKRLSVSAMRSVWNSDW